MKAMQFYAALAPLALGIAGLIYAHFNLRRLRHSKRQRLAAAANRKRTAKKVGTNLF